MSAVSVKSEPRIETRGRATKPRVIVVATDGTPQSEPAIAFTRAFADRAQLDVRAVSVVDHLPMPWGVMDRNLVAEYEHALRQEARDKTKAQLSSFGLSPWAVEIQEGDPATRISAFAKSAGASLVVLGLGEHGAAARLFGSETALRLARVSQTPVLAVAPNYREAPRRILVAMDFSEASIEAARVALEFAAKDATIVLAHVVPWERKEYVPENWFKSHESSVGAELTRVSRWLDESRSFRIGHRILYGKPAPTLLSCAEELDCDLIVAGSHSRTVLGRALAGQTIPRLIRGARCSVLILPAAAAFNPDQQLRGRRDGP
jgi:nucleotide-binding universal stress UspA family protein